MWIERFQSMIRREVERTMRKLHKPTRMGLVSSYDKKNHAIKVKFQPEGTESGWIPLSGHAIGNQFGIATAPFINDQVEISYQEGGHMVGRVMTRHWSTKDQPPQIDPGEYYFIHQQGTNIYFKKDGTLHIGGASDVQTGPIGQGQSGNLTTGQATGETGQQQQQQTPQQANAKQTIVLNPDGSTVVNNPNGLISATSSTSITLTAPTINIIGNTHIGSSGGVPCSKLGTVDTCGCADVEDLATKVWVT